MIQIQGLKNGNRELESEMAVQDLVRVKYNGVERFWYFVDFMHD